MKALAWFKAHKQETMLAAGGIVVTVALYVRSRSSSTSSTGTAATTTDESALPVSTDDTSATDIYSGLEDQITAITSELNTLTQTPTPTGYNGTTATIGTTEIGPNQPVTPPASPAPAPAAPAAPAASSDGYGQQSIGGQLLDLLGYTTGSSFTGYNVGGGAPVFYQTPGGSLETDLNAATISGLPAGTEVLTPAAYAGQISSTTVSGEQI